MPTPSAVRNVVETLEKTGLSPEQVLAIGSFFERDADVLRSVASGFKKTGRTIESRVQGWSMGAALPDGARIRIRCSLDDSYPRGTVIAFLSEGKVVVHRVIRKGRVRSGVDYLVTRGDSLLLPDFPVHMTSVLGPVIAFEASGSWRTPQEAAPRPRLKRFLSAVAAGTVGAALDLDVRFARFCTWGFWECQRWLYQIQAKLGTLREGV